MKMQRYFFIFLLLPLCNYAQDNIFSQFYNATIYLNPALTGQFEGSIRFNGLYRNQWTGLSGDRSYATASADLNLEQYSSGIGVIFNRSSEGTAFLTKNNIALSYAFIIPGDDFTVSFGLQGGITNQKINFDKLVFGDQVDMRYGYIQGSVSGAERADVDSRYYFDAAAGANLVFKNLMAGVSMHHINRPDESISGFHTRLPIRISASLSYKIALLPDQFDKDGTYLIPSALFYKQQNTMAFSVGTQFKYRGANAGIWYRSDRYKGGNDAIVFSMIFDIFSKKNNGEKIRLGLSHDATTSKLNYTNTGGTTEIGVGYEQYFSNSKAYGRYNGLRCYDFY